MFIIFKKNLKNQISTNKTTSSFRIFFGFLSFFCNKWNMWFFGIFYPKPKMDGTLILKYFKTTHSFMKMLVLFFQKLDWQFFIFIFPPKKTRICGFKKHWFIRRPKIDNDYQNQIPHSNTRILFLIPKDLKTKNLQFSIKSNIHPKSSLKPKQPLT